MAELVEPIEARIDAHPYILAVYDAPRQPGREDIRQPPYVLFYVYVDDERRTKLNQNITDETWIEIETHSAGIDRAQSDLVRGYVRTQLIDWVPEIAGLWCSSVSHRQGDTPDWDTTTGVTLMDAIDYWQFRTKPQA